MRQFGHCKFTRGTLRLRSINNFSLREINLDDIIPNNILTDMDELEIVNNTYRHIRLLLLESCIILYTELIWLKFISKTKVTMKPNQITRIEAILTWIIELVT